MLKADADNKYAFYNLGLIAQNGGRLDDATKQYRRVLELDPKYEPALFNLAIIREHDGDTAEAVALYLHVIEANPAAAGARLNLGLALKKTGDITGGEAEIKKAVELNPALASASVTAGSSTKNYTQDGDHPGPAHSIGASQTLVAVIDPPAAAEVVPWTRIWHEHCSPLSPAGVPGRGGRRRIGATPAAAATATRTSSTPWAEGRRRSNRPRRRRSSAGPARPGSPVWPSPCRPVRSWGSGAAWRLTNAAGSSGRAARRWRRDRRLIGAGPFRGHAEKPAPPVRSCPVPTRAHLTLDRAGRRQVGPPQHLVGATGRRAHRHLGAYLADPDNAPTRMATAVKSAKCNSETSSVTVRWSATTRS